MLNDIISRYPALTICSDAIEDAIRLLVSVYKDGGTLYSAADAEHISGELLKGFLLKRALSYNDTELFNKFGERGSTLGSRLQGSLPAVPISSLTALSTATANDNDAEIAFAQAVWGLVRKNDVLIGISTSGNSKNIIYAAIAAKVKGAQVIALSGETGGNLKQYSDVCICVPETETYKIQELHLPIYHYICTELERHFFSQC